MSTAQNTIQPVASAELVVPEKGGLVRANMQGFEAKLTDGTRLVVSPYSLEVAVRYPRDGAGNLVANRTQSQVAEFLRDYNQAHGLTGKDALRYLTLFEDEAIRAEYGKRHRMFDENFNRNGQLWNWGYLADFTRSHHALKPVDGVDGQTLIHRELGFRLPEGDIIIGLVTMAPSGIVPRPTRKWLEKKIGAKGLRRLEKLRGYPIIEKVDEIVGVKNRLGYAQYTLSHNYRNGRFPHSSHFYPPSQEQEEAVGVRRARWLHHGDRGCFYVFLNVEPGDSRPDRSFPLVRGGGVEAKIIRPAAVFSL